MTYKARCIEDKTRQDKPIRKRERRLTEIDVTFERTAAARNKARI